MVGGGKARQAQLVVAGVGAKLAGGLADLLGAALPEGAVDLPRLAEAAAAQDWLRMTVLLERAIEFPVILNQ